MPDLPLDASAHDALVHNRVPAPPTAEETQAIGELLVALELPGDWELTVLARPRSPWLSIDLKRVDPHPVEEPHAATYALWRTTCAIYEVDEHGAAGDDPMVIVPGIDAFAGSPAVRYVDAT